MSRYREDYRVHTQGNYEVTTAFGPRTYGGGILSKKRAFVRDTLSKPPYHVPHDLDVEVREIVTPWYITGEWQKSPTVRYVIDDHYTPGYGYLSSAADIPLSPSENWDYWFTKAIANMNPNIPRVDVPLFVLELRDFPKLLRNMGDWLNFLAKRKSKGTEVLLSEFRGLARSKDPLAIIPDSFLTYNFGWAPLLTDLRNLQSFQQNWEQKIKDLSEMKGGERIKHTLYRNEDVTSDGYYVWLMAALGVNLEISVEKFQHIWFTASPTLLSDVPKLNDNQSFKTLMFGLNELRVSTLWNTIPWSWLIDYFYNVSDVLNASGGLLEWEYDKVCLMSTYIATYTLDSAPMFGTLTTQGLPKAKSVSKRRRVRNHPTPTFARTPWLSQKQQGNLGALSLMVLLGK